MSEALENYADQLESQLRLIAAHWPGKWTRYCMACDHEWWPCQTVLDVVVPWMRDEEAHDE